MDDLIAPRPLEGSIRFGASSHFSSICKLEVFKSFRSNSMFVTGNNDGSVSLFNGSQLIKTKRLSGTSVCVGYSNGQIVAAAKHGNLTIMNENLALIKEFDGMRDQIRSIAGNETHFATCGKGGSV